jgi:hypothetical protein
MAHKSTFFNSTKYSGGSKKNTAVRATSLLSGRRGWYVRCAVVLTHMVLTTVYFQIYVRKGASNPHPRTEFQGSFQNPFSVPPQARQ